MSKLVKEVLDLILLNIELSKRCKLVGTVQYIEMLNKKQKEELYEALIKNGLTYRYEPDLQYVKVYSD